jgi:hypothetical protein
LKRRCLEWVRIAHLSILNISYDQKKGQKSNWQFDSRPLKVRNRLDFLMCRWHATYRWKGLNKGYNFSLYLISIEGLHVTLCPLKVVGVRAVGISGLLFGSPGTKSHLDVAPVERHKVYYKGEGGGFPQLWDVVSFVSLSCSWLILAPKVFQLCTNHFMLVLCRFVWVVEACQFFLVPFLNSNMPLYLFKMLRVREHALTPYSSIVFQFGLTFESFKELGMR